MTINASAISRAGTIVVHERTATPTAAPVWFPPPWGYEAYTATLDVSGLDAEAYELVRSFLLRAHTLTPGARLMIAGRLARPIGRLVHQLPPPDMPDELFLSCVAAAYQQRSWSTVASAAHVAVTVAASGRRAGAGAGSRRWDAAAACR